MMWTCHQGHLNFETGIELKNTDVLAFFVQAFIKAAVTDHVGLIFWLSVVEFVLDLLFWLSSFGLVSCKLMMSDPLSSMSTLTSRSKYL